MKLGSFSVSLAVKDLAASRAFYEALGFSAFAGHPEQGWLIMKNEGTVIGLFQGMLPANSLTFNPGWDTSASPLAEFDDVRVIQQRLKAQGIALIQETGDTGAGPAYITLTDPDGNAILIDQHV